MRSKTITVISLKNFLLAGAVGTFGLAGPLFAAPEAEQKGFDTPKLAADALIQAAESFDVPTLASILGPGSGDIISSEDTVQDKSRAVAFAAIAREKMSVEVDPKNPNSATLVVGNEDWPLPIPIVKRKAKWYFDTKAGREEILLRRIGANELDVLEICHGYVDAQVEYAAQKYGGTTRTTQAANRPSNVNQRPSQPNSVRQQPATSDRSAGNGPANKPQNRMSGGGDSIGNTQVSKTPSARNTNAFGGASGGMNRSSASASHSRGASSMGGSRGGGRRR